MSKTWFRFCATLLFSCLSCALWGQISIPEELAKAEQLYAEKNYNGAVYHYTKIINEDPRHITAYKGMGDCYFQNKNYEEALKNYKRVEWLEPDYIDYRLGLTYYCIGDYRQAKGYFIKSIRNDPTRTNVNYYLGRIHEYHKEDDFALDCFKKELELAPIEMNYLVLAKFYYKRLRYDESVAVIDSLVKEVPWSAEGYLLYGQIAEKRNFENKAIEDYQRAARLGSGEAQLWLEQKGVPWRKEKGFLKFLKFWED